MKEISENSFVSLHEVIEALKSNVAIKTKEGKINISGTVLSGKEFDKLYLNDIKDLFAKYEETISPEFAPTKQLYSTLDIFSSPVLSSTGVPKTVSAFYKKMQKALETPENKKVLEKTLTTYVKETNEAPIFMLAHMHSELSDKNKSSIYKSLAPDSSTLLEGYGTKFSGSDILYLANTDFIEPEAPMNMLVYKSLHAQDENSSDYIEPVAYDELLDFYSPEQNPNRMRTLLKEGKITPAFTELHQEMLENVSSAKRKAYISDLIDESKQAAETSDDFSEEIIGYANTKIIPDTSLENNISGEFLKKQYIENKISFSRVFAIYKTAPKYFSAVESILTPEEIIKAHSNDEIEDESLMYIPEDSRVAYLQKNNTKFSTMMYLFLHCDGLSITELKQLLTENKVYETLDFYIDLGSNPLKIKELYENYLIDYQCIKNLKTAGILTDKDFQKYNFSINKEKIYQDISNTENLPIVGSGNMVPFSTTGALLGINLLKPTSQEALDNSFKVLGAPEEHRFTLISHVDQNKKPSFLDKYKIVPLRYSNLVALVPPTNNSSIYLMPYQEAAFILYNNRLPNNFSENTNIKEIKKSERLEEDLLKTANQFEEAKPYLMRLRI